MAESRVDVSIPPHLSEAKKHAMIAVLKAHGIRRAALFDSFARGDATAESDIDVLIEPPPNWSLFDLSHLGLTLEALLHRSVDLVTYNALNPRIAEKVLAQQVALF